MRNWLNPAGRSYRGAIGIGDPIRGTAAVEILPSRHPLFKIERWRLGSEPIDVRGAI
nr:hypothetical protein [uncultured Sphingobium sp.]